MRGLPKNTEIGKTVASIECTDRDSEAGQIAPSLLTNAAGTGRFAQIRIWGSGMPREWNGDFGHVRPQATNWGPQRVRLLGLLYINKKNLCANSKLLPLVTLVDFEIGIACG